MKMENNMHTYTVNVLTPTSLESIMQDKNLEFYAAKVDGRLRELSYVVTGKHEITFLGLEDDEVMRMYETTLRYLISKVMYELYPSFQIAFHYSYSRAIYMDLKGLHVDTTTLLNTLKKRLDALIASNHVIKRETLSKSDAINLYQSMNKSHKTRIYAYRDEESSNIYTCEGYKNYLYGYMLASTGYIKSYSLIAFQQGLMIQYPRAEYQGSIPPFIFEDKYKNALKHASKWHQLIDGDAIDRVNAYAENPSKATTLIQMSESRHSAMLYELAEAIRNQYDTLKLIGIAGPSSSGKTTFAKRLVVELLARGLSPVMISLDDYYLSPSQMKHHVDGKPDLEHIEALDLALFNAHLKDLIALKEVTLPHFDFMSKQRVPGKKLQLKPNEVIVIEGIHGLNPRLTEALTSNQIYKIYIGPQSQLHIDMESPIRISDMRLLRRIVRDIVFRDTPAEKTFDMWQSVRQGEFKWIYPFQQDANYVFNSALTYEINVLKKHALKHLKAIETSSPYYMKANYLIKFLKYVKDIDDDLVPNHSLLREFIGGSVF